MLASKFFEIMKIIGLIVGLFLLTFNISGQPGCVERKIDYNFSDTCKILFTDSGETRINIVIENEHPFLYRKETTYSIFRYYIVKSEKLTKYLLGTNAEGNSFYRLTFFEMPNYEKSFITTKAADLFKPEENVFFTPHFISKQTGCCEYTDYYELSTFPENEKFLSYNISRLEIHAKSYDNSKSRENYVIYFGYDMCSYYQDTAKTSLGTLNYSINQKINGSVVFKKKNPKDPIGFAGYAPSKIQLMENGIPIGETTSYYGENPIVIHSDNLSFLQDFSEINNLGVIVTFMFHEEGKDNQGCEKDFKIEFVNGKIQHEEIIVE
jgi:hypothetical protein